MSDPLPESPHALADRRPRPRGSSARPAQTGRPVPGFGVPADKSTYWPLHTLTGESVQKELKFTDEQTTAAAKLREDLAKQVADAEKLPTAAVAKAHADLAKRTDRAIDAILTAGQKWRHREVTWQVVEHAAGILGMANNPVFAKELGLTATQVKAIAKIARDHDAAAAARKGPPMGGGGGGGTAPAQPPMTPADIRAAHDALLMKALTAAQKQKWDDLTGEPFLQKIEMPHGTAPFGPPIPKK